jgi:hypothetical protein
MTTPLLLSSVASGIIATAVMTAFLYLPVLWGGTYYDSLGALGAVFTGKVDGRSRFLGGLLLLVGGIVFALFYGWTFLMLRGPLEPPDYTILPGLPVRVNLFFPLLGIVMGLAHGVFVSLLTAFVIADYHPVHEQREPFPVLVSFVLGHVAYGVVVMFFHSQFLPLLGATQA